MAVLTADVYNTVKSGLTGLNYLIHRILKPF